MFQLSNINIIRDNRTILSIEELAIPSDELTVVLGHNGSGKSTLVNLLSGQMSPDHGTVEFKGTSLSSFKSKDLAKNCVFAAKASCFSRLNRRRAGSFRAFPVERRIRPLES
jgi:iron complex transport system ATP-binding protein